MRGIVHFNRRITVSILAAIAVSGLAVTAYAATTATSTHKVADITGAECREGGGTVIGYVSTCVGGEHGGENLVPNPNGLF